MHAAEVDIVDEHLASTSSCGSLSYDTKYVHEYCMLTVNDHGQHGHAEDSVYLLLLHACMLGDNTGRKLLAQGQIEADRVVLAQYPNMQVL